ncbi:MAG: sensor histidine kinase [Kineosporiaceae bacterium]
MEAPVPVLTAVVGGLSLVAVVVAGLALHRVRAGRTAGDPAPALVPDALVPGTPPPGASGRPRAGGGPGAAGATPDGPGVVDVLDSLRAVAVVVDPDLRVVRATSTAYGYGLVTEGCLRHQELRDLAADTRREGRMHEAELELKRGISGSASMVVGAKATPAAGGAVMLLLEDRGEARRLAEIKSDFLVNVSHELKTPVGAISLLAETLTEAADDPAAVRRFAERMRTETERLSRLVHDVIELSRLQTADALTSSELLDVDRVVQDALDLAGWRAEAEQIPITVGPETGLHTFGDHDLLVTAVRNLLDNAISYSPPHTGVAVAVGRADDFVEVAVSDRGHGIPPAEQRRIFERFYRIDPARSRRTGGTGLGLAIVKHVAENHGGEATVRSRPGEGSTFTLRLPVADPAPGSGP